LLMAKLDLVKPTLWRGIHIRQTNQTLSEEMQKLLSSIQTPKMLELHKDQSTNSGIRSSINETRRENTFQLMFHFYRFITRKFMIF